MKGVNHTLQQAYAHDAMLCIPVALLHNTVKLQRPMYRTLQQITWHLTAFNNCLLEQVVRQQWLSRAQPSCWG